MATLGTFTAGQVLTAAELNAIATTSTTYTPIWSSNGTQPDIGNGTLVGRYIQINKLVWVQIFMALGSTSTIGTGAYFWSLPSGVTARTGLFAFMSNGVGRLYDASVGVGYTGHAGFYVGETTKISGYEGGAPWSYNYPFTFGINDEVILTFTYEAA